MVTPLTVTSNGNYNGLPVPDVGSFGVETERGGIGHHLASLVDVIGGELDGGIARPVLDGVSCSHASMIHGSLTGVKYIIPLLFFLFGLFPLPVIVSSGM